MGMPFNLFLNLILILMIYIICKSLFTQRMYFNFTTILLSVRKICLAALTSLIQKCAVVH